MSDEEIAKGSVGISESSHALLVSLVYDVGKPMEDRPFEWPERQPYSLTKFRRSGP